MFIYTTTANMTMHSREYVDTDGNETKPVLKLTLASDTTTSYNVKYQDANGNAIKATDSSRTGDDDLLTDSTSSYIGLEYSYSPEAYIYNTTDKSYYKYSGVNADGSVTPITGTTAADSAIEVPYAKIDDVVSFAEAESLTFVSGNTFVGGGNANSTNSSAGLHPGYLSESTIYKYEYTAPYSGNYTASRAAVNNGNRPIYMSFTGEAGTADNEIVNGKDSIFGYYADFTGNGYRSYTIKADLYAENASNNAEGLELGTLSGTGSVTVFVITNAAINADSRVYCE